MPRREKQWRAVQLSWGSPLHEVVAWLFYFLPWGGGYDETTAPERGGIRVATLVIGRRWILVMVVVSSETKGGWKDRGRGADCRIDRSSKVARSSDRRRILLDQPAFCIKDGVIAIRPLGVRC